MSAATLVVLALLSPSRFPFAECITFGVRTAAEGSAMVFSGTVSTIESSVESQWGSEVITFEVDRVWKGAPGKKVLFYNFRRSVEPFIFSRGTKYLVFANRQTVEERADFGFAATGPETFGVGQCGGGTRTFESAKGEIGLLGPGRAP